MIPTQPNLPNPFDIHRDNNNTSNMYQCYGCGQWIGNMQYHNCPGPGRWNPVRTVPLSPPIQVWPEAEIGDNSGGMVSELMMYSDFKKLMKRDTLAKFRERFVAELQELETATPEKDSTFGFGIDVIEDVFDHVAKGFDHDNSL